MLISQKKKLACATLLLAILIFLGNAPAHAGAAEDFNRRLRSGVNLGNALEAPKEGDWGVVLQPEYFSLIKSAGLSHVRVPVSWSTHAATSAPYTIDPAFFDRIDWVVKEARKNNLAIVINMHHYEELEADPAAHWDRFIAMWKQIAEHMRNERDDLAFEFYNEPAKSIEAEKWNKLFAQTLQVVRQSNPRRCVVVGPVNWNDLHQLSSLKLPDDKYLVATIHYYDPKQFTHQGAGWMGAEAEKWLGTKWSASADQMKQLSSDFDEAAKWAHVNNRPMYLGEFGAYEKADMDSRICWTKAVRAQAKSHGFSDAYWEFCSGFGMYDPQKKEWREPLLNALKGETR
jgi:endoglucanase